MKFIARERKMIDAIRWTGDNTNEVAQWAEDLGLVVALGFGADGAALAIASIVTPGADNGGDLTEFELWAVTLHGEVEIEPGSWAAFSGADVYPLADSELHRLYEVPVEMAACPRCGSLVPEALL